MASPLKLEAYDIIICGGGTAGCVLAARLTEDPNLQVLMLEAGTNANSDPKIYTPGMFPANFASPDRDWNFLSEPSPGLNGRQIGHSRGKCIGGSSAINLMALCYPSKTGLDTWAEMGNPGWDWESMKFYYRRFQTFVPPSEEVREALGVNYLDSGYAARGNGPIKASFPQVLDPLHKAWIDTWKRLGKHSNPADGVGYGGFATPNSIDVESGKRSFAGSEYFEPVKGRRNLHVVTEALIERVELEGREKGRVRATGARFSSGGKTYTAKARRDVVLCGGVFGSPQMLELSGIGSKELCEKHGIESVIDNPYVGENMQDHLMCGPAYEVKDGINTTDMVQDPSFMEAAMRQYNDTKTGPLAWGGGYTFAYTPLCNFLDHQTTPDSITHLLDNHPPPSQSSHPALPTQHAFIRRILTTPTETSASMLFITIQFHPGKNLATEEFALHEPENYVSILTQLAHPFSRGSVHIQSPLPTDPLKITPNYLSHPLDAEILGRHLLQCEAIMKEEHLASMLKPNGRILPDKEQWPPKTLQDAIEFGRKNATSNYHPSGTCAMLPKNMGGVVSPRLVVHGTENLRVVDASIFPIEPRGNIMSSVYAAAEKGADMIKEDLRR